MYTIAVLRSPKWTRYKHGVYLWNALQKLRL